MVDLIPPAKEEQYVPHSAPLLPAKRESPAYDILKQAKEIIAKNPEKIREIAPDFINRINSSIDEAPMGLSSIVRQHIYSKFPDAKVILEGSVSTGDSSVGSQDDPGHEMSPQGRLSQGNQQEIEPEDIMTTQDVQDIIEYMAELSEQGLALPEIADAVWRDYRIEYHPLRIKRMLKSYYARPDLAIDHEPDASEKKNTEKVSIPGLKLYKLLLDRITKLEKDAIPIPIPVELKDKGRNGLLTRFFKWLL